MTRTDFYILMSGIYLSQTMGKTACLLLGFFWVAMAIYSVCLEVKAAA